MTLVLPDCSLAFGRGHADSVPVAPPVMQEHVAFKGRHCCFYVGVRVGIALYHVPRQNILVYKVAFSIPAVHALTCLMVMAGPFRGLRRFATLSLKAGIN